MTGELKACYKCKTEKPLHEFSLKGSRPHSSCRSCLRASQAEWRKARRASPEYRIKLNEQNKRWREANPEKAKESDARSWARRYKDQVRAYAAKYRERNKGLISERNRKYREKHKEKILARQAEWVASNRELTRAAQARYRQSHLDRANAANRAFKESLPDSYVKRIIRGRSEILKSAELPQALIDAKRELIRLNRIIRSEINEKC